MKYERIIMIAMLVLLWAGLLSGPLSWIVGGMTNGLFYLFGMGTETEANTTLAIVYTYIETWFFPH
jgi:LytS/YehU family sensor histidine kinase